MRLIAFVPKRPGINPGQRFRIEQWLPHLEAKHGMEIDFCAFESEELSDVLYRPGHVATKASLMLRDYVRRAVNVPKARRYDAAIVYREVAALGPAVFERALSALGVPFVFDFDDAIWMPTPATATNARFAALKFRGKTRSGARLASAVTVGNEYLASWARQFNDNVHVVPTSIDLAKYDVQPDIEGDTPFVIGWMGSHSTRVCLEYARAGVERFGLSRRVRVVIVCDRPMERPFANTETVFVPWRGDREAADLGTMHIGIMPLADDEFSKGKCGCKALQYMAAGRPAVVSAVGVNVDIVQHGVNGFVARDEAEWVDAFERLAASTDLRRSIARAGRATVERKYSSEASAAAFARAIESMFPNASRAKRSSAKNVAADNANGDAPP